MGLQPTPQYELSITNVHGTARWLNCPLKVRNRNSGRALRGRFNVYNMTALVAGSVALGYDRASVEKALGAVETVPGRMDRVPLTAPFAVIVDYAHTPDALVNILQTARPLTKGKLICVFGCGGDRDRTKRPLMGTAVATWADEAIVTSDNPRSERPIADHRGDHQGHSPRFSPCHCLRPQERH
jgi:UDP-N-acetylmuramyl tripeptide synthase